MRSPRFLAIALVAVLAATIASVPTSASARVDHRGETRAVASGDRVDRPAGPRAASASRAEGEVTITSKLSRRKKPHQPYQWYLRGKVTGSAGPVAIQRATACNKSVTYCNFTFYRKVWVRDDGVFDGLISAPKTQRSWVWRARVGTVNGADWWQTCTTTSSKPQCELPTPAER